MVEDRNILVGIIALQAGIINGDQLALATAAWSSNKSFSLAQVLESSGLIDGSKRIELEKLAAEKAGDEGDAAHSTLSAFASMARAAEAGRGTLASPSLTTRATLDQAATVALDVGDLRTHDGVPSPTATSPTRAFEPSSDGLVRLSTLGASLSGEGRHRYARTHLHARGGIGQVWLARDDDLGRDVALKELRPEQSRNPSAWSRFLEEARITGQLEHPGIVPVYELAASPDDQKPFYTMRFIRGRTFGEAILDYHKKKAGGKAEALDLASLLTAFVAACNAVGYAHSRGVIHRDLKGQNIVLGDYGEVMVIDWGIAKLLDRPEDAGAAPPSAERPVSLVDDQSAHDTTIQGQVLGTPSYMAPEQAEGRIGAIDQRADIYGLGAILYEILAGTPPFSGNVTSELLRQVREEPPRPIREVDPQTPKALEAICDKAMSKAPEGRYPSALALAEDVRRWLADEPVSTYREPWPTRLARWSKRHRTAVSSAAALLVTALVLVSFSAVLIGRERDEARRQRKQARQAVDTMYSMVAEQWLEDRLDPLQREILEKALAYYQDFAGPDSSDPVVRQETGRALLRLGDVLRKLGRHREAEDAYRRSIKILSGLADDRAAVADTRVHLAEAISRLAAELASRAQGSDLEEAGKLYPKAELLQGALLAESPSGSRRLALGRTARGQADLSRVLGKPAESEAAFRRSVKLLEEVVAETPGELPPRQELAAACDGLGVLLKEQGQPEEAMRADRRAVEILEKLAAEAPTLPQARDGLAKAYNSLGLLVGESGSAAEAESILRKQVEINERLAADFPARPEYRRTLARALMNLGRLHREANRSKEAEDLYRRALELNEKLAAGSPEDRKFRRDQAACLSNLGELLAMTGRRRDAEPLYRKSMEIYESLVAKAADLPENRKALAGVLNNLGVWLKESQRPAEAIAAYGRSIELSEALAVADPANPHHRRELGKSLTNLGNALQTAGRRPEAEDAYRRAENCLQELVARPEARPADRLELANCLSSRGTNRKDGQLPGAEESLVRSNALFKALAAEIDRTPDFRLKCAAARYNLGEWSASARKDPEAEAAFGESVGLFAGLADDFPKLPYYRALLGQSLANFALLRMAQGRPGDARTLLERAVEAERAVFAATPRDDAVRETLRQYLATLADVLVRQGAHAEATRAVEDVRQVAAKLPWDRPAMARLLVRCIALVEADARLTPNQRAVHAGDYADRAIALLRESIEREGDAARLLEDDAFSPLRDRDGFKTLSLAVGEKAARPGE